MNDVTVILLAAGLSRRMGARNKLLLPVDGVPMIRHMVNIYAAVTASPVLVVTGHDADLIGKALEGCHVQTVFNPAFADGQQTSVVCGLNAAKSSGLILIGLGDQPQLTRDDLHALLAAHRAGDPNRISIPRHGEQRGNPIVVPGYLKQRLLDDRRSPGCKHYTRENPQTVQYHALDAPGFFADVDTPQAYAALNENQYEVSR